MWDLAILENYTAKIRDIGYMPDLSAHEKYNKIFEFVREIHCNSRTEGVMECKRLIIRTIEKEI
jgi:hypothetical protein